MIISLYVIIFNYMKILAACYTICNRSLFFAKYFKGIFTQTIYARVFCSAVKSYLGYLKACLTKVTSLKKQTAKTYA